MIILFTNKEKCTYFLFVPVLILLSSQDIEHDAEEEQREWAPLYSWLYNERLQFSAFSTNWCLN